MTFIGNISVEPFYVLAPMAGYTDMVFRSVLKPFGCSLVYTEMISAAGLAYRDKNTPMLMDMSPDEHPIAFQLFGHHPDDFAKAVPLCESAGADFIDLNCGCPVPKVVKQGAGSALMKSPDVIKHIIRAVRAVSAIPITIKFRSGWDMHSINVVELSQMAEAEGVSAICVHPRTRSQAFSGHADWTWITRVKQAVSIPVIGSGDVYDAESAQQMKQQTHCDAVMIGRSAINVLIPIEQRLSILRQHVDRFIEYKGERYLPEIRKFVSMYVRGLPGASGFRQKTNFAKTKEEFYDALTVYDKDTMPAASSLV